MDDFSKRMDEALSNQELTGPIGDTYISEKFDLETDFDRMKAFKNLITPFFPLLENCREFKYISYIVTKDNMLIESDTLETLGNIQGEFEDLLSKMEDPNSKRELEKIWLKLKDIATKHELTGKEKLMPKSVGDIWVSSDLDNLKLLNSELGYDKADQVISLAAEMLDQVAGMVGGKLFHPHGDEFFIKISGKASLDDIILLINGLKQASDNLNKTVSSQLGVKTGITSGVSVGPDAKEDAESAGKFSKHYSEKGGPRLSPAMVDHMYDLAGMDEDNLAVVAKITREFKPEPGMTSRITAGPRRRAALLARTDKKPHYKTERRGKEDDRRKNKLKSMMYKMVGKDRRKGPRRDEE